MRKIIVSEHISLDGFVAGPGGEMDWIKLDDDLFDLVREFTDQADAALYGRVTWQMMDNYWPSAGSKPDASKHDIEHSTWYNNADKIVLSRTMDSAVHPGITFVNGDVYNKIDYLKKQEGKNILTFGSPSAVHLLMEHNLIDEYWLFLNPVILGEGIPLFAGLKMKNELAFVSSRIFSCGVLGVNYKTGR